MTRTSRRSLAPRVESMEARIALTSPGGVVYNPGHPITSPATITLLNTNTAGGTTSVYHVNLNVTNSPTTFSLINSGMGLSKGH